MMATRRGSLTHARASAKSKLSRMPVGSIAMIGQWLNTGKYEALVGGGLNYHERFMPVEQVVRTARGTKTVPIKRNSGMKKNPPRKTRVTGSTASARIKQSKGPFYVNDDRGEILSAANFKRMWPGGRTPTPLQRRMLGWRKISKAEALKLVS